MPTVAIVGASNSRDKYGNKALRAFRAHGYTVVPINPNESLVEGERAYPNLRDYPGPIDEVSIYVQPEVGIDVMEDVAVKGIPMIWLNPGADAPEVVARARALGLSPRVACSIRGIGDTPSRY